MKFFGSAHDQIPLIVYDIGSGSVGGAVVLLRKGANPEILYTTREHTPLAPLLKSERVETGIREALARVSDNLLHEGISLLPSSARKLSSLSVRVSLGAPWYVSQTRIVRQEDPQPFTITENLLTHLKEKEKKAFYEDPLVKRSLHGSVSTLIEHEPLGIFLNGYKTEVPLDKQARSIHIPFLFSVSPKPFVDEIERIVTKAFRGATISYYTFPAIASYVLGNVLKNERAFLFCDVGGEISDITLVEEGIIVQTVTVPLGRRAFLRFVGERMNMSPQEVLPLISMLHAGDMLPEQGTVLRGHIEAWGALWRSVVEKELAELSLHLSLPDVVFFTVDPDVESFFAQFMRDSLFAKLTLTNKPFRVFSMNASLPYSLVTLGNKAEKDIFIMICALMAHTVWQHPAPHIR